MTDLLLSANGKHTGSASSEDYNRSTVKRLFSSVFSIVPQLPSRSTATKKSATSKTKNKALRLSASSKMAISWLISMKNFMRRASTKDIKCLSCASPSKSSPTVTSSEDTRTQL